MRKQVIAASTWTMGAFAISQVIRLGGSMIQTRLLFPEAFGIHAIAFTFMMALAFVADIGVGPAIVRSPNGDDPRFLNTAWTIQCIRGVSLFVGYCVIGYPVALFYEQPLLTWMIPAIGLGAMIDGFNSTAFKVAQRHLQPRSNALMDIANQAVTILTIITVAWVFRPYFTEHKLHAAWALVAGGLAAELVRLWASFKLVPGIKHRFMMDPAAKAELINVGRAVFISTMFSFFASQADRLIFGKKIPLELLGVYGVAAALGTMPAAIIQRLCSVVLFPAYSRLIHRPDFKVPFWRARYPLLLAGGTLVAGIVASGPALIDVIYDDRYQDAGWILRLMAIGGWFSILESMTTPALHALGRFSFGVVINVGKLAGIVVFVPLGFYFGGFAGALLGLALSDVVKYLVTQVGVVGHGLSSLRQDLAATVVVAAVSAAAIVVGKQLAVGNAVARLLLSGSFVVLVAAAPGYWYWRSEKRRRAQGS
jgi:O-antigen/teichoic acid export membrane protein